MKRLPKLIVCLFLSISFSAVAVAQHAMVKLEHSSTGETEVKKEAPVLSPKQIYLNHTKMAAQQFQDYLASSISYPEQLEDLCLEGELIVEVTIARDGVIKDVNTIKSLHTELDHLVLSSVLEMQKIDLIDMVYMGARRLRIPVNFSLK